MNVGQMAPARHLAVFVSSAFEMFMSCPGGGGRRPRTLVT